MSADVSRRIILGSRGSELARAQTAMVTQALQRAWPELEVAVEIIKTRGDERKTERIDPRLGRKGLFTGEIERGLAAGKIDIAVHSAKDLPSDATPGLEASSVLPRAAVEDVLISKSRGGLIALPEGCVVGTGSVRRQSQLRWLRPDLRVFELQGNVPTRLRKLDENPWQAIVLARAGIERLGYELRDSIRFGSGTFFAEVLETEFFLPAGGQGVIALQIRSDDSKTKKIVELLNDMPTLLCLRAEREFLRLLQGDCGTPVGVLATVKAGAMTLRGQLFENGAVVPKAACVEGEETAPERLARRLWEAIGGK
jgi:hydroxymethylbilane synthase